MEGSDELQRDIADLSAIASEYGGRIGFLATPEGPDDSLLAVIVLVVRSPGTAAVKIEMSHPDGSGAWRLLLEESALNWLLENSGFASLDDV